MQIAGRHEVFYDLNLVQIENEKRWFFCLFYSKMKEDSSLSLDVFLTASHAIMNEF